MYKETGQLQIVYLDVKADLYQIKFSKQVAEKCAGQWEILNTTTQYSRKLIRKQAIKGPFVETKTIQWSIVDDEGVEIPSKLALSERSQEIMA